MLVCGSNPLPVINESKLHILKSSSSIHWSSLVFKLPPSYKKATTPYLYEVPAPYIPSSWGPIYSTHMLHLLEVGQTLVASKLGYSHYTKKASSLPIWTVCSFKISSFTLFWTRSYRVFNSETENIGCESARLLTLLKKSKQLTHLNSVFIQDF